MNRDKQINAMYKDVYEAINHNAVIDITHGGYIGVNTEGLTKELYDDGYRKASDLAREIFEEIDRMIYKVLNDRHYIMGDMCYEVAELKKKYTEEGKNV